VSTDEQDEGMQLTALRELASQRGWQLVAEYVDHGVSSRKVRPQLETLMRDAQKHKFDAVAVWKFDRFARSTRELVFALEQFENWGIAFVSATQGIDTSGPMGRLVFSVLAAIAEFERDLIRERVIAGMREARRKGKHCGRPMIGFDIDQAAELRRGGMSWRKMAAAMGVPVHLLRARLASMQNNGGNQVIADKSP
jgi:putative DNA-invertase from lambdoid prophage Rac